MAKVNGHYVNENHFIIKTKEPLLWMTHPFSKGSLYVWLQILDLDYFDLDYFDSDPLIPALYSR